MHAEQQKKEQEKGEEPYEKTPIEAIVDAPEKTLKLGKKTKVVIFTLLLVGFLIILVPIIIAYSVGVSSSSSNDGENSIFNDPIVFERLGLVAMDTPQICDIQ